MKKISVIMPCHNVDETLKISLSHIERQTIGMDSLEVILVDDSSTDDGVTLGMLQEFEKRYPQDVVVISLSENVMQGGARNIALGYATGKYVAYCDADDWFALNALEQAYNLAEQYNADVMEFGYKFTNDLAETDSYVKVTGSPVVTTITNVDERKAFFMGDVTQVCWNKIYKTTLLTDNNILFSEKITNQEVMFTFMCRILEKTHVKIDDELYYYYQNDKSCTHSSSYESRIQHVLTSYEHFLLCAKSNKVIYDTYKEEIDFVFWSSFLLPLIYKSKDYATFYTRDELLSVSNFVKNNIAPIVDNKYFIEKFSDAPIIGELAFMDLSQIDLLGLKEAFKSL